MQRSARWLLAATALACALADYLRSHTFHTIVGDITFGPNGEWTKPRVLAAQFQGVSGHYVEQFKDPRARFGIRMTTRRSSRQASAT
jgi:hypothetical protein